MTLWLWTPYAFSKVWLFLSAGRLAISIFPLRNPLHKTLFLGNLALWK